MSHVKITHPHNFTENEKKQMLKNIAEMFSAKHKTALGSYHAGYSMSADGMECFLEANDTHIVAIINVGFATKNFLDIVEQDMQEAINTFAPLPNPNPEEMKQEEQDVKQNDIKNKKVLTRTSPDIS